MHPPVGRRLVGVRSRRSDARGGSERVGAHLDEVGLRFEHLELDPSPFRVPVLRDGRSLAGDGRAAAEASASGGCCRRRQAACVSAPYRCVVIAPRSAPRARCSRSEWFTRPSRNFVAIARPDVRRSRSAGPSREVCMPALSSSSGGGAYVGAPDGWRLRSCTCTGPIWCPSLNQPERDGKCALARRGPVERHDVEGLHGAPDGARLGTLGGDAAIA